MKKKCPIISQCPNHFYFDVFKIVVKKSKVGNLLSGIVKIEERKLYRGTFYKEWILIPAYIPVPVFILWGNKF